MYSPEQIDNMLGRPIGGDLIRAVQGSLTRLLAKQFAQWAARYARRSELIVDAISNTILVLVADPDLDLQEAVNLALRETLAEHRQWIRENDGQPSELPWDPIRQDVGVDHQRYVGGFQQFRDDQFIGNEVGDVGQTDLPIDLGSLTENEITLITLLGDGWSQHDAALEVGWHPDMRTDHRGYVQNRLRTIRRKLTGAPMTQKEAWAWLNSHATQS